jgi:hypothetical protein
MDRGDYRLWVEAAAFWADFSPPVVNGCARWQHTWVCITWQTLVDARRDKRVTGGEWRMARDNAMSYSS